jgi:hypothetical protein
MTKETDEADVAVLTAFSADAERFSAMFASFAKVGPELKKIGSLRGAERESEARITALRAEEARLSKANQDALAKAESAKAAALLERDAVRRDSENARKFIAEHMSEQQTKAAQIVQEAQARAAALVDAATNNGIVLAAQEQAAKIIDAAKVDAVKLIDDARGVVRGHENTAALMKASLAEVSSNLAQRRAQLDELAVHAANIAASLKK